MPRSPDARRPTGALLVVMALTAVLGVAQARDVRVIDGDTVEVRGEIVRLKGVDAPEIRKPLCLAERRAAHRAKQALERLAASGYVTVERTGRDRWRRTVGIVRVGGRSLGATMVEIGHAKPWNYPRDRKPQWC